MVKIIHLLQGFIGKCAKIQRFLGVVMLAVIIISVSANIFIRYLFDLPFSWTEELSIFLFVWIVFLGAGVAAAEKRHVALDILSRKLPQKTWQFAQIVINILIVLFLSYVIFGGIKLQPETMGQYSTSLRIEKNWYYLPVVLCSIYMIIIYVTDVMKISYELIAGRSFGTESKTQGQRYIS